MISPRQRVQDDISRRARLQVRTGPSSGAGEKADRQRIHMPAAWALEQFVDLGLRPDDLALGREQRRPCQDLVAPVAIQCRTRQRYRHGRISPAPWHATECSAHRQGPHVLAVVVPLSDQIFSRHGPASEVHRRGREKSQVNSVLSRQHRQRPARDHPPFRPSTISTCCWSCQRDLNVHHRVARWG